MSDEQINIAIAEACNKVTVDSWGEKYPIPYYCSDLNAMHEAENVLEEKRLVWQYEMTLGRNGGNGFIWSKIHATARQRAEAFLRTIGKWEGAK